MHKIDNKKNKIRVSLECLKLKKTIYYMDQAVRSQDR